MNAQRNSIGNAHQCYSRCDDLFKIYRAARQGFLSSYQQLFYINQVSALSRLDVLSWFNYKTMCSTQQDPSQFSHQIVSLDSEIATHRYWLSGTRGGIISIFDHFSEGFPEVEAHLSDHSDTSVSCPHTIQPIKIFNVCQVSPSQRVGVKQYTTLLCSRYIPYESGGIITSNSANELQVWDVEYCCSMTQFKMSEPLLSVKLGSDRTFSGFFASTCHQTCATKQTGRMAYCNPTLVACCVGPTLQIVDLRLGDVCLYLYKEGSQDIRTAVRWNPQRTNELISGSHSGFLDYWDMRKSGGANLLTFSHQLIDLNFPKIQSRLELLRQCFDYKPNIARLISPSRSSPIADVHFVMNGKYAFSVSFQNFFRASYDPLQLWNVCTGSYCPIYYPLPQSPGNTMSKHIPIAIESVRSGDTSELICCGVDSSVTVYELMSASLISTARSQENCCLSSILGTSSPSRFNNWENSCLGFSMFKKPVLM